MRKQNPTATHSGASTGRHPRFYPKSVGPAFWIYDEDGWPSGTDGGQLLKKFSSDTQLWAELVTKKTERCLAGFKHAGKQCCRRPARYQPRSIRWQKNFADPADAPANTLIKAWHLRLFRLPQKISSW